MCIFSNTHRRPNEQEEQLPSAGTPAREQHGFPLASQGRCETTQVGASETQHPKSEFTHSLLETVSVSKSGGGGIFNICVWKL